MVIYRLIFKILVIYFVAVSSARGNTHHNDYSLNVGIEYKFGGKPNLFLGSPISNSEIQPRLYITGESRIANQYTCKSDNPRDCRNFALLTGSMYLVILSGMVYLAAK